MQRRRFLTGATAVGVLLAGCTSSGDDGDGSAGDAARGTDATTATPASGTTEKSTDGSPPPGTTAETDATTDAGNGSYAVSMPPVGNVTFDAVPETWVANNGSWADMGIALGRDPPKAVWLTERYHTHYYDAIDGVSVDKSDMVSLYSDGVSKELFYELDGDIHVMDPNFLTNRYKGWEQSFDRESGRNGSSEHESLQRVGAKRHRRGRRADRPVVRQQRFFDGLPVARELSVPFAVRGLREARRGIPRARALRGLRGAPRGIPVSGGWSRPHGRETGGGDHVDH